jgi:hypothetical protein
MAATYEKIQSTTLGSSSASISFTSIPSTYTDLRLVFIGTNSAGGTLAIQYNNDTATNYSTTYAYGNATASYKQNNKPRINITDDVNVAGLGPSGNPSSYTIDILSYTGSGYKTCLFQGGVKYYNVVNVGVGLWRDTAAINRIDFITSGSSQYNTGTSVTIYGIKAA